MGFFSAFKKIKRDVKKVQRTMNKFDKIISNKQTQRRAPDSTESKILNYNYIQEPPINGFYNLNSITSNEDIYMRLCINAANSDPIKFVNLTLSAKYKHRYLADAYIEQKYQHKEDARSLLAVAIACKNCGASKRKKAAEYYELFENAVSHEGITEINKLIPMRSIFLDFSKIFESEYRFDKSVELLKKAKARSRGDDLYSVYENMARVYSKIDINKCINFIEKAKKLDIYIKHPNYWEESYAEYYSKREKGYIFKPRKQKSNAQARDENVSMLVSKYL